MKAGGGGHEGWPQNRIKRAITRMPNSAVENHSGAKGRGSGNSARELREIA